MTPLAVAAVVLVGVLGAANLVLCIGIIRRLREHTSLLDQLGKGTVSKNTVMLTGGEQVGDFQARTLDGVAVRLADLRGTVLVGFFSLDCSVCVERLPEFVDLAAGQGGGRDQVLAMVVGNDDAAAAAIVATLAPVARVSRDADGALRKAFGVEGFPAFAVVDDGVVRDSSYAVSALPVAVA